MKEVMHMMNMEKPEEVNYLIPDIYRTSITNLLCLLLVILEMLAKFFHLPVHSSFQHASAGCIRLVSFRTVSGSYG